MPNNSLRDSMLIAASVIIVLAAMKAASAIVLPFLLSGFLALLAAAPMTWLTNRGVPLALALPTVVLLLLGTVTAFVLLIASNGNEFAARFPFYQQQLEARGTALWAWLANRGIDLTDYDVRELLNPSSTVAFVGKTFNQARKLLTNGLLILLTVIFMLVEAASMPTRIRRIMRSDAEVDLWATRFVQAIRHYLVIKFGVSLVTGLLAGVLCWAVGLDFPVLWAVVAFALNFIPTIGSILASVPPILLALVQLGPIYALGVALGYMGINVLMGNGIEPRLTGQQLGLSTLVVFLSLVFWGWLLGPIGMLLSVPLTISIKFALEASPETARYGALLDAGEPRAETQA